MVVADVGVGVVEGAAAEEGIKEEAGLEEEEEEDAATIILAGVEEGTCSVYMCVAVCLLCQSSFLQCISSSAPFSCPSP
jgi:hypothetical protein